MNTEQRYSQPRSVPTDIESYVRIGRHTINALDALFVVLAPIRLSVCNFGIKSWGCRLDLRIASITFFPFFDHTFPLCGCKTRLANCEIVKSVDEVHGTLGAVVQYSV